MELEGHFLKPQVWVGVPNGRSLLLAPAVGVFCLFPCLAIVGGTVTYGTS